MSKISKVKWNKTVSIIEDGVTIEFTKFTDGIDIHIKVEDVEHEIHIQLNKDEMDTFQNLLFED